MIPKGLTTGERIIYSMLPSGVSSARGLHNACPDLSEQGLRKAISSLCQAGMLQQTRATLKGADRHRRSLTIYSITPLAVSHYFPRFRTVSPVVENWLDAKLEMVGETGFCAKPNRNAASWERLLRVIECEQFLSAAGVKTLLDSRPSTEIGVFGRSEQNLVSQSQLNGLDFHSVLFQDCEAAAKLARDVQPCEAGEVTQDPCSAYSFYRSSEIVPAMKRWERKENDDKNDGGTKDMNLIRSTAIGFIHSTTRRIAIYRTAANGGTSWTPVAESAFFSQANAFVRRTPGMAPNVTSKPMEAIVFYKDDRELLGLLKGKSASARKSDQFDMKRLGGLGEPYKALYAIPFNQSGMNILKQILSDEDFLRKSIESGAYEISPDAEVYSNYEASFPVSHLGEEIFCAIPLDVKHLSILLIDKTEEADYSILCYSCYKNFLERLLGGVMMYDIEPPK